MIDNTLDRLLRTPRVFPLLELVAPRAMPKINFIVDDMGSHVPEERQDQSWD